MTVAQQTLLNKITEVLEEDSRVVAAWLEGSIARKEDDEWSDIDLWISVKEKSFEEFVEERELFAAKLGDVVNVLYPKEIEQEEEIETFQIVLEEYPPTLHIDVSVQSQHREFRFTTDSKAEECKVLFDRAHIIKHQALNKRSIEQYAKQVATDTIPRFWHDISKVIAYLEREDLLEATHWYIQNVEKLVTLYRVMYTPEKVDWGWKDVEYDLPKEAIDTLYDLLPEPTVKLLRKRLQVLVKAYQKQQKVVEQQFHIQPPQALIDHLLTQL